MEIKQVFDEDKKQKIVRNILENLPDWFGILEAREEYILDSIRKKLFCCLLWK